MALNDYQASIKMSIIITYYETWKNKSIETLHHLTRERKTY